MSGASDEFEFPAPALVPDGDALQINVDGYEGPLDLLLAMARTQKVDLREISILALVEQYLAFVREARRLRLELAADYLVMAAWLAYLKSRLLLPKSEVEEGEPDAEELALRLTLRLQRLEAMREVGSRLMGRDRMGRDVFARGGAEPVICTRHGSFDTTLYDLLRAYADFKLRTSITEIKIHRRPVYAIEDAVKRLESLVGTALDWTRLRSFFPNDIEDAALRKSAVASFFVASLELAKQGQLELRQVGTYGPLYLRQKKGEGDVAD